MIFLFLALCNGETPHTTLFGDFRACKFVDFEMNHTSTLHCRMRGSLTDKAFCVNASKRGGPRARRGADGWVFSPVILKFMEGPKGMGPESMSHWSHTGLPQIFDAQVAIVINL